MRHSKSIYEYQLGLVLLRARADAGVIAKLETALQGCNFFITLSLHVVIIHERYICHSLDSISAQLDIER